MREMGQYKEMGKIILVGLRDKSILSPEIKRY